jgi:hypothetical protein
VWEVQHVFDSPLLRPSSELPVCARAPRHALTTIARPIAANEVVSADNCLRVPCHSGAMQASDAGDQTPSAFHLSCAAIANFFISPESRQFSWEHALASSVWKDSAAVPALIRIVAHTSDGALSLWHARVSPRPPRPAADIASARVHAQYSATVTLVARHHGESATVSAVRARVRTCTLFKVCAAAAGRFAPVGQRQVSPLAALRLRLRCGHSARAADGLSAGH